MRFSHVFVARPGRESVELADMLAPLDLRVVIQPAFEFEALEAASRQPDLMTALTSETPGRLLIFTSTRAVEFGLPQLPDGVIERSKIAAIGPATSLALKAAGVTVDVRPRSGFTSEALLQMLTDDSPGLVCVNRSAVILAAPGGRKKMEEGLAKLGWSVEKLMVYERKSAPLNREELGKLQNADSVLSVWTSANAMRALAQRLPPAVWFKLCQGEWVVISERLKRLAWAYGPAEVHLAPGPGNYDLFTAVKTLI